MKARYLIDKSALARMPIEAAGLTLLHYDHDYDLIAEVTRQPAEWVVERGSV